MASQRIAMTLVTVVLFFSLISMADADDGVPLPVIPRGQGENCVEAIQLMRRDHMTLLQHQRVQTTREGIRSKQHSLKGCINCHAVMGADAMPVSAASPQHFCRACHDYAAVSIDCFECHSSRPESETIRGDHALNNALHAVQITAVDPVRIN